MCLYGLLYTEKIRCHGKYHLRWSTVFACVSCSSSVYPLRDIDLENDSRTSEIQVHMSGTLELYLVCKL